MKFQNIFFFLFINVLIAACNPGNENKSPEFWVWMHPNSSKTRLQWENDFRKLNNAGFTGVLIGANPAVLRTAIPQAKQYGLKVQAWMWTMNRGDADTLWLSVNQQRKSLSRQKAYVGYYKFMCPALPEVRAFLKSKIDELSKIEGLDGIHMDYIRYVDAILPIGLQPKYNLKQDSIFPEFDYGYHPYLVDLYQEQTGINPFGLHNPANDHDWVQFRLDQLNKTVAELRDYIHSKGLSASAAVFPTPALAREMVRQEWNKWNLDSYFPMAYHNFYNKKTTWIKDVMVENKAAITSSSKIICGLYVPALKDDGDLQKAIAAALNGGADGVALFDFAAMGEEIPKVNKFLLMKKKKMIGD